MAYSHGIYRDYEHDFDDGVYSGRRSFWSAYRQPVLDISRVLEPLISHLQGYDAFRINLEKEGGEIQDLKKLTEILCQEVAIPGRFREYKVSLINQTSLSDLLHEVGDFDLHLEVRQLQTRLPVYYLCRLGRTYRSEYELVLEDLYVSPGYPLTDERFVKLMRHGRALYHLRLSPFRSKTEKILADQKASQVDNLLSDVGRHIFQAAWHEDQRLGVMVARHFGLPLFHQAIEVLYLCLSGELCDIRGASTETMFRFFRYVYPQPAIHGFLKLLLGLEGSALTSLTQEALGLYTRLSQAFKCFLSVKVRWGFRQELMPLEKLVFGNFSRLSRVAEPMAENPEVREAKEVLELAAGEVVAAMVEASENREESHAYA